MHDYKSDARWRKCWCTGQVWTPPCLCELPGACPTPGGPHYCGDTAGTSSIPQLHEPPPVPIRVPPKFWARGHPALGPCGGRLLLTVKRSLCAGPGGAGGLRRSWWSSWLASAPRREKLPWNLPRWKWDPGVSLWAGNNVRGFGADEVQMCRLSFSSAALNRLRVINSAGTGWASLSLCLQYVWRRSLFKKSSVASSACLTGWFFFFSITFCLVAGSNITGRYFLFLCLPCQISEAHAAGMSSLTMKLFNEVMTKWGEDGFC